MLLDKTIRENLDGRYLIIYGESFREGIEYAAEIDIPQIQLRNNTKCNSIDFKELEKIPALKVISFVGNTTEIINLDSIYSLKDIQKIYFQQKQKFKIDISKFPNIKHIGAEYWNGLDFFNKAYGLKSIVFSKFSGLDLKQMSPLLNLKVLHIYSSKIQTLEGIELLPIEELFLARNNQLEDIQVIEKMNYTHDISPFTKYGCPLKFKKYLTCAKFCQPAQAKAKHETQSRNRKIYFALGRNGHQMGREPHRRADSRAALHFG